MKNITQEKWEQLLASDDQAYILDVRTQNEVDAGIIPNSHHIDIYEGQGFIDKVNELDKSKNYYIYCRSGNRSGQAAQLMDQLGFETTYNLIGGFMEWDGDVAEAED